MLTPEIMFRDGTRWSVAGPRHRVHIAVNINGRDAPTLRRNQRRLARNQTPELVDGANGETERERIIQTKEGDFVPIVVDIGHRAPHQISKLLGSFCSATIHLSGKESKAELFGHLGSG
jgi:hypothetical protein